MDAGRIPVFAFRATCFTRDIFCVSETDVSKAKLVWEVLLMISKSKEADKVGLDIIRKGLH